MLIDYVQNIGMDAIKAHEQALLEYGTKKLKNIEGLTLYAPDVPKAAIFSFTMKDVHHSDIGTVLDQCGVAVRAGHHCCMPLMEKYDIEGTVRASAALYSSKNDIDQLVDALNKARDLFL